MMQSISALLPIKDVNFSPKNYFGIFEIIKIRVGITFDKNIKYATIKQDITARKIKDGPNGWCAFYNISTYKYCKYFDVKNTELDSLLYETDNLNYYKVTSFNTSLQKGDIVNIKIKILERVDGDILKKESGEIKTLVISRMYGSNCEDYAMEINIPDNHKLIDSVPILKGENNIYTVYSRVKELDPIQQLISIRKVKWYWFQLLFKRNSHPIVWASVSAIIGLILAIIYNYFVKGSGQ